MGIYAKIKCSKLLYSNRIIEYFRVNSKLPLNLGKCVLVRALVRGKNSSDSASKKIIANYSMIIFDLQYRFHSLGLYTERSKYNIVP